MEDWSKESEELQRRYHARMVAAVTRMGELRPKMKDALHYQVMHDVELAKRMIYYQLSRPELLSSLKGLRQHLDRMKVGTPITTEANDQEHVADAYRTEIGVLLKELPESN